MMDASVRKSSRGFSAVVGFSVFIATVISGRQGTFNFPRHTSPNSPKRKKLVEMESFGLELHITSANDGFNGDM